MPDGIGHGGSSKPSNGMRARFPHYGYRDMIRAQHRLLTEGLKVDHLRLVIGTSMGGMHTWLWGETYPEFMDALMPLASLPTQIAGRNRMMRRTAMDSIRSDPEWKGGEYEAQPRAGLTGAHLHAAVHGQQPAPVAEGRADARRGGSLLRRAGPGAAEDRWTRTTCSTSSTPRATTIPEPALETIRAPLVADQLRRRRGESARAGDPGAEIRRVPRGRAVLLPITDQTRGHGTHSWPALWQDHLAALLRESDPQAPASPAP